MVSNIKSRMKERALRFKSRWLRLQLRNKRRVKHWLLWCRISLRTTGMLKSCPIALPDFSISWQSWYDDRRTLSLIIQSFRKSRSNLIEKLLTIGKQKFNRTGTVVESGKYWCLITFSVPIGNFFNHFEIKLSMPIAKFVSCKCSFQKRSLMQGLIKRQVLNHSCCLLVIRNGDTKIHHEHPGNSSQIIPWDHLWMH